MKVFTRLKTATAVALASCFFASAALAYDPNTVPSYCQSASPWSTDPLGFSSYTLGGFGCFVTCIGDETQFFQGGNWNPRVMNNWLKATKGGFQGALVTPSKAPGYKGSWAYPGAANLSQINSLLDAGYLVIAETRWQHILSRTHYVLLTGRSGNTYAICDPADGKRLTFQARYGDPGRWIYSVYAFGR